MPYAISAFIMPSLLRALNKIALFCESEGHNLMSLQEMWWSMMKILWHFNGASQLHTIYDEFEGMDPRPRILWRFIEFVIIEPTKYDVLLNSS